MGENLKVWTGTFRKVDGSLRVMTWVYFRDIPELIKRGMTRGGQRSMPHGPHHVLVWDVEISGIRQINTDTFISGPEQIGEMDPSKIS